MSVMEAEKAPEKSPQMQETQEEQKPPEASEATETSALEAAEKRIAELEAQVKEKEAKYLYLYADFENFKKRAVKERSDLVKFGWESVARELLQVIDNLERAIHHMPPGTDKTLADGIQMVLNQFRAALAHQGVQTIETAAKPFDPNLHEAVGQESSDQPEGTVIQEHQKGYTLHGRLLRPARVIVSAGKNT